MDRRDALARVALLMGGTVIGADFFLSSCSSPVKEDAKAAQKAAAEQSLLSLDQTHLLDEVGETILPATQTPGAKAARVGRFMAVMVRDCYTSADQKIFMNGLTTVVCSRRFRKVRACPSFQPSHRSILVRNIGKPWMR